MRNFCGLLRYGLRTTNTKNFKKNAFSYYILNRYSPNIKLSKNFCLNGRLPFQFIQISKFSDSNDNLPDHLIMKLPALSPTMTKGKIIRWLRNEGDKIEEGMGVAEIETDKATISMDVADDCYLAKILVPEGKSDVNLGAKVCIVVYEKEDVKSFENFQLPVSDSQKNAEINTITKNNQDTPDINLNQISYPDHTFVKLPSLSPTMSTGKLIKWNVKVGSCIAESDVIASIETDKATIDFEALEEGYVAKILKEDGGKENLDLGTPLLIMVDNESDIKAFENYEYKDSKNEKSGKSGVEKSSGSKKSDEYTTLPSSSIQPVQSSLENMYISPYAKVLATEKNIPFSAIGVDFYKSMFMESLDEILKKINKLKGTGIYGSVTARDVNNYKETKSDIDKSENDYFDVPISNMRRTIGERLTQSKSTIPHYYLTMDINTDNMLNLRKELNEHLLESKSEIKQKLSPNDFIVKAMSQASTLVPQVNSTWSLDSEYIRTYKRVDVSVAVATKNGLITPIVFNANKKSVLEISNNIKQLAAKARENKLKPNDYIGGTITVSNLGMYGIKAFTAIINPPQVSILAVGQTRRVMDSIEAINGIYKPINKSLMSVTLSCDHRVVDGAV
ncbi:hypothetical protein A3Q56_05822, partial [Intoshia linei]